MESGQASNERIVTTVKTLVALVAETFSEEPTDDIDRRMRDMGSDRLLAVYDRIEKLLTYANVPEPRLTNTTNLDVQFQRLLDANDILHERTANYLDAATSTNMEQPVLVTATDRGETSKTNSAYWNRPSASGASGTSVKAARPVRSAEVSKGDKGEPSKATGGGGAKQQIVKPQTAFADCIDNLSEVFKPKLKVKHHALVPWPRLSIVCETEREWATDTCMDHDQAHIYEHPYKFELEQLVPAERLFEVCEPVKPTLNLEETPLTMVDSQEKLVELCRMLNEQTEFAVDIEANNYRSYQGLTCLLQISTRHEDYILDPFPLWRDMHLLNEPFTDPNILKVFHGANKDVEWLQRDFGVYVVNVFDTYQALCVLQRRPRSLAHLVLTTVGVTLDKSYKLADWRIRPLPPCMIKYAREDSHYLLYCYDVLRNTILEQSSGRVLLEAVFNRSRDVCLTEYRIPPVGEEEVISLCRKMRMKLSGRQMTAFRRLFYWRDSTARRMDESAQYVMSDGLLAKLAELLPRDISSLMIASHPAPPALVLEAHNVHRIISEVRRLPESEATENAVPISVPSLEEEARRPHDFSHLSFAEELTKTRLEPDPSKTGGVRFIVDPAKRGLVFHNRKKAHETGVASPGTSPQKYRSPFMMYQEAVAILSKLEPSESAEKVPVVKSNFEDMPRSIDLPDVIRLKPIETGKAEEENEKKKKRQAEADSVPQVVFSKRKKKQPCVPDNDEAWRPHNYRTGGSRGTAQYKWVNPALRKAKEGATAVNQSSKASRAERSDEGSSTWQMPKRKKMKGFTMGTSMTVKDVPARRSHFK